MTELLGTDSPLVLVIFLIVAATILFSAAAVVTRRQPVAAIGWLVVHFMATAGAYLMLDSEFLAAVQVLVYAGAILVLFLFVIMLIGADRMPDPGLAGGGGRKLLVLALVVVLLAVFGRVAAGPGSLVPLAPGEGPPAENTVEWLADALFSRHLLAFELASIPLLAAMAGVLVYTTRRVRVRKRAASEVSS